MNVEDLWAEYARIAKIADSDRLTDRAIAADEALDEILNHIQAKTELSRTAVSNLLRNRWRKHRARRGIMARNAPVLVRPPANDNSRYEAIDALRRTAKVLTSIEARVLFGIGQGKTYGELALAEGVPISTVKTWVRRARAKIS